MDSTPILRRAAQAADERERRNREEREAREREGELKTSRRGFPALKTTAFGRKKREKSER
jgi:hypothetical protein